MSEQHPLDGKYHITTTTTQVGHVEKRSDGETEIVNSQTERLDEGECKWTSTFEIMSDSEVKMTSVADPTNAKMDYMVTRPDGIPTREIVTYEAILKLARKGDRIQLSGQIKYGCDTVFLTMRSA